LMALQGKWAIITGGNSGVGFETARAFLQQGANVVIAQRSHERGEAAAKQLAGATGAGDRLHTRLLDTSNLSSVREFAHWYIDSGHPLHLLVNNAGLGAPAEPSTADGNQTVFATNYLGHALLTLLLLPVLRASAPARIINIASHAHLMVGASDAIKVTSADAPNFDLFNSMSEEALKNAYAYSKWAQVSFTVELQRRLDTEGTQIAVHAVHPGLVDTNIFAPGHTTAEKLSKQFGMPVLTPEQGAQTGIHVAIHEDGRHGGQYWSDSKPHPAHPHTVNAELNGRLWEFTVRLIGYIEPAK